jgi:hypothetical protein
MSSGFDPFHLEHERFAMFALHVHLPQIMSIDVVVAVFVDRCDKGGAVADGARMDSAEKRTFGIVSASVWNGDATTTFAADVVSSPGTLWASLLLFILFRGLLFQHQAPEDFGHRADQAVRRRAWLPHWFRIHELGVTVAVFVAVGRAVLALLAAWRSGHIGFVGAAADVHGSLTYWVVFCELGMMIAVLVAIGRDFLALFAAWRSGRIGFVRAVSEVLSFLVLPRWRGR